MSAWVKEEEFLNKTANEHKPKKDVKAIKKSEKLDSLKTLAKQRIWSRLVVVIGVIVYVWYSSKPGKEISLAKRKEIVLHRGQNFDCSDDYLSDINKFVGCAPKQCGRYVTDMLVNANEVKVLLKIAKQGIALGGSNGGASILDLHTGALSLGDDFVYAYSLKSARGVIEPDDLAVYKEVKSKIQHSIAEIFSLEKELIYLTYPTFFSRLTNVDPKAIHDEYWRIHVDKETYESFYYTSLLYLSDYGVDFTGGRLIFLDGKPPSNITVEPRKGRVVIFSSGAENPHFVERVTSGTRYAITVSFTCDKEFSISDPTIPEEE